MSSGTSEVDRLIEHFENVVKYNAYNHETPPEEEAGSFVKVCVLDNDGEVKCSIALHSKRPLMARILGMMCRIASFFKCRS